MIPEPRTQFVFLDPCGCPRSVVEGSFAKTEDGAWDEVADTRADERRLRERGVIVVHVPHEEYVAKYLPMMRTSYTCAHAWRAAVGVRDQSAVKA